MTQLDEQDARIQAILGNDEESSFDDCVAKFYKLAKTQRLKSDGNRMAKISIQVLLKLKLLTNNRKTINCSMIMQCGLLTTDNARLVRRR